MNIIAMDIERMHRLHKMIYEESTGTPDEVAETFNVKKRQLYYMIDEFRDFGAVIKYSRKRCTYYYAEPFDFFSSLGFDSFSRKENKKIMLDLLKSHLEQKKENA